VSISVKYLSPLILTLFLCACNSAAHPQLEIQDAWVNHAKVSEITAGDLNQTCICERVVTTNAYLEIENSGYAPDRLLHVETDQALNVELRDTALVESFAEPVALDAVVVPARGKAVFSPGDYGMVLNDLRGDLNPGDQVELKLFFEQSGELDVTWPVQ
jgi:copper(I)-binding protein